MLEFSARNRVGGRWALMERQSRGNVRFTIRFARVRVAASVVLAGGRGERRIGIDNELAIAQDPQHGQFLSGAAAGAATEPIDRKWTASWTRTSSDAFAPDSVTCQIRGELACVDSIFGTR
jgi:hypothetical protein